MNRQGTSQPKLPKITNNPTDLKSVDLPAPLYPVNMIHSLISNELATQLSINGCLKSINSISYSSQIRGVHFSVPKSNFEIEICTSK
jgi:hypothetical protein